MEKNISEVNKRVRKYRKAAGLTQAQVARSLNMKRNTYSHMELHGEIPAQKIMDLAELFNVSAITLMYGEEKSPLITEPAPRPTFEEPKLFNSSDVLPLNMIEANGIRIFRNLPKDKADEVIAFLDRKYQETKHPIKPFDSDK